MREVDRILERIEDCIGNNYYESVETEVVELKPTLPNLVGAKSALESICAFMNTNGGILILGIKDNNKTEPKNYELKGYHENAENLIKSFGEQFTDKDGKKLDVSEYIVNHQIRDFLDKKICIVYIDKLPDDQKYVFLHKIARKRTLTGDDEIDENAIARHEEFKEEKGASRGMSNLVNEALANKIDMPYYRFYSDNDLGLFIPKGKLVDDAFIALLNSFDLFIETRLNGSPLKEAEIAVLAYFYKSEKANALYRHTILLSPDNNHFEAIGRLEKSGIIIKHSETAKSHDMPIFLLNRVLMQEEYIDELRKIFGGRFDELPEINKQVLSLIYQFNHYNKNRSISATQAGRLLFDKTEKMANSSAFDNFKRKIYTVFKKLVTSEFLKEQDKKDYFINENFKRTPSIFDNK